MILPRLRVLVFCQLFYPLAYGGGEVLFWNLTLTLASRGHEVYVITQRIRGRRSKEKVCGINIIRVGVPAHYTGALTTSFLDSLIYLVEASCVGFRLVIAKRINIIHSNTYVPAFAGQLCASLLRRIHVMTVHDVYLAALPWFWSKWSQQRGVGVWARVLGPLLERTLLRLPVDVIHTVSETSKRDLTSLGVNSKIVVVPNGIDPAEYDEQEEYLASGRQAIFIGRLVFYKNLELVFRALSGVIDKIPDARLLVVGDGPMRVTWRKMVAQLGMNKHVTFHGKASDAEKIVLLKRSSFLILPSLVEGFGIVALEAFACKKPVLVSDIGALRELVTDGVDGYLIDAFSAEDWTNRMIYLFAHPLSARRMGAMGRRKLDEHYTIKHVVEQMETMYEDCLKS